MQKLKIRNYRPEDKDVVWKLHINGLLEHGIRVGGKGILDKDMDDIENVYLKDGGFIVGQLDGKIVAMGAFKRIDDDTAEIKRMRVDKDFQRMGFGQAIIQELEKRARAKGYKKMLLSTNQKWKGARDFYKKNGYTETGKGVKFKIFQVVFYEKELV